MDTPPLTASADRVAAPVVLLWHGRGPNEAHVLDPLVAALQLEGHVVLAPNWDSGTGDRGAGALAASLDQAVALTRGRPDVPLVVVGWSLGGKAALSLALDPGHAARVSAVVGLAAGTRGPSPVDGSEPLARVRQGVDHGPPPIYLVHGRGDTVVPAEDAEEFTLACRGGRVPCSLALVDTDHAGIVGTRYDSALRRCVPDDALAATIGMAAALEAVRRAVADARS